VATRISAEFTLTGTGFNPDEVTSFLGIHPAKTWRKGDLVDPRTLPRYKHDGWKLSAGYKELDEENAVNLSNLVLDIFHKLQPHTSRLKVVCEKYKLAAELTCVMYIEGNDRPEMHFDHDVVKWLAELNAETDLDLHVLPKQTRRKRRVKAGKRK